MVRRRQKRPPAQLLERRRVAIVISWDGTETVSCTWFSPADALAAYERGAISLIPPTLRTLDDLARFAAIDAALEAARVRVVRARRPEVVIDGDVTTIAYPDNTGTDAPPRQLVLRDGRWRPTS